MIKFLWFYTQGVPMKINTKFIFTLATTLVLTACGGSSGGAAPSANQPKVVSQGQDTPQEQGNTQKPNQPQKQNDAQTKKPQEQNAIQKPNNAQEKGKPQVQGKIQPTLQSPNSSKEQHSVVENKPQSGMNAPTKPEQNKPTLQEKKIDASFEKIGSVTLNKDAQTLTLSQFTLVDKAGTSPKFDNASGKQIIEEKDFLVLNLADINAQELSSDFLIRRSDDLFYGYYNDTNSKNLVDAADKFSQYFVVYDEKRVNSDISDKLTATYRKKEGFVYGSNPHTQEFAARISKLGDVEIQFEDGQAHGTVKDGNAEIFTITGDTKQLEITPTEGNPIIMAILSQKQQSYTQGMEKAVMDTKFIDSQANNADRKYLIGEAKSDNWQAVMVSEKQ